MAIVVSKKMGTTIFGLSGSLAHHDSLEGLLPRVLVMRSTNVDQPVVVEALRDTHGIAFLPPE